MRELIQRRVARPAVQRAAGVAVAYVLVAVVGRWIARATGLTVPVTPGLVVGLALLVGSIVAWGAAVGVVVLAVSTGSFGPETVVPVFAQFLLVAVAIGLWGAFGRLSSGEPPGWASPRNAVEFAILSVTAGLVVGGFRAWAGQLAGAAPFAAVVADLVVGAAASILTVGAVTCYLGARVRDRRVDAARAGPARETRGSTGAWVLGVALAWTAGGLVLGIAFQTVQLQRSNVLVNRFGRTAAELVRLAGPGGAVLQALVGAAGLACCLWLLGRAGPAGGEYGT